MFYAFIVMYKSQIAVYLITWIWHFGWTNKSFCSSGVICMYVFVYTGDQEALSRFWGREKTDTVTFIQKLDKTYNICFFFVSVHISLIKPTSRQLVALATACGLGTPSQSQSWFLWGRTVARSLVLESHQCVTYKPQPFHNKRMLCLCV